MMLTGAMEFSLGDYMEFGTGVYWTTAQNNINKVCVIDGVYLSTSLIHRLRACQK